MVWGIGEGTPGFGEVWLFFSQSVCVCVCVTGSQSRFVVKEQLTSETFTLCRFVMISTVYYVFLE